jgi:elongation factor G
MTDAFSKALARFSREDPTLRVHTDEHSQETIISGMGELHLEIYVARMEREYNVECVTGRPAVNYREAVRARADFNYLHKKQSGGSGQYARVVGYIEAMEEPDEDEADEAGEDAEVQRFEFLNEIIGTNVPPEYIPSCEKGAKDAINQGGLIGHEVHNLRVVLTDGAAHAVDSSDMAFRTAMATAVRTAMQRAQPCVLEPVMSTEVTAPAEFQGAIIAGLNRRMGMIQGSDMSADGSATVINADVPLSSMFGYSTELRSNTQGKGEFSMEYNEHLQVPQDVQGTLIKEYAEKQEALQSVRGG